MLMAMTGSIMLMTTTITMIDDDGDDVDDDFDDADDGDDDEGSAGIPGNLHVIRSYSTLTPPPSDHVLGELEKNTHTHTPSRQL